MSEALVFYTHPMSRGRIVRWMLEELGQPYRTELLEYGALELNHTDPTVGDGVQRCQRGAEELERRQRLDAVDMERQVRGVDAGFHQLRPHLQQRPLRPAGGRDPVESGTSRPPA